MAEKSDKRGAPRGDQSKPAGKRREGTAHEGKSGNLPHERNAFAAAVIERLSGYGLPQKCMSDYLEWMRDLEIARNLGDQGYSVDTLHRHYRDAMDRGKPAGKEILMGRVYQMAMMENLPEGVTPDRAYTIAADKLMALLNIQHGIMPHQSHRHAGPGGGPIPIALLSCLDDEELNWLERISRKLEAAAAEQ